MSRTPLSKSNTKNGLVSGNQKSIVNFFGSKKFESPVDATVVPTPVGIADMVTPLMKKTGDVLKPSTSQTQQDITISPVNPSPIVNLVDITYHDEEHLNDKKIDNISCIKMSQPFEEVADDVTYYIDNLLYEVTTVLNGIINKIENSVNANTTSITTVATATKVTKAKTATTRKRKTTSHKNDDTHTTKEKESVMNDMNTDTPDMTSSSLSEATTRGKRTRKQTVFFNACDEEKLDETESNTPDDSKNETDSNPKMTTKSKKRKSGGSVNNEIKQSKSGKKISQLLINMDPTAADTSADEDKNKNKVSNNTINLTNDDNIDTIPIATITNMIMTPPQDTEKNVKDITTIQDMISKLNPEMIKKYEIYQSKMTEIINELYETEKLPEFNDTQLELDAAIVLLEQYITQINTLKSDVENSSVLIKENTSQDVSTTTTTTTTNTHIDDSPNIEIISEMKPEGDNVVQSIPADSKSTSTPIAAVVEDLSHIWNTIIARYIQGSSLSLTPLIESFQIYCKDVILCRINNLLMETNTITNTTFTNITITNTTSTTLPPSDTTSMVYNNSDRKDKVLSYIQTQSTTTVLSECIKSLAERESYRNKAKNTYGYENTDETLLWRWDVKITSYFPKHTHSILRESKIHRGRYRKLMKALSKVQEFILKNDIEFGVKVIGLEDNVSTAKIEINKAKEKRKEQERKRLEELEVKRIKEEQKEQKRKEREEQLASKVNTIKKVSLDDKHTNSLVLTTTPSDDITNILTEVSDINNSAITTEKKAPVLSEKKVKEKEAVERQKNILASFFNKKPSYENPNASTTLTSNKNPTIITSASTDVDTIVASNVHEYLPSDDIDKNSMNSSLIMLKSTPVISLNEDGTILQEDMIVSSQPLSQSQSQTSEPYTLSQSSQVVYSQTATATTSNNNNNTQMRGTKIKAVYPWQRVQVDIDTFTQQFNSGMPIEVCVERNKARYQSSNANYIKHKPVTIDVTVSTDQGGFGGQSYSEIRKVTLNPRMKTLSFSEDTRPAYVGTFSKNSGILSGRNPWKKDCEVFNYEYDSEEEWEEEEEGEDIVDSDGEDENETDELEYDDVFVRDNDFGSDVGSDGEIMAKVAMRIREGEERLGIRFITSKIVNLDDNDVKGMRIYNNNTTTTTLSSSSSLISSVSINRAVSYTTHNELKTHTNTDQDIQRLSGYTTVMYPIPSQYMPCLGEQVATTGISVSTVSMNKSEQDTKEKVIKPTFDQTKVLALAQLIHGKKEGIDKLVQLFHTEYSMLSRAEIKRKIMEIAERKRHQDDYGTPRWICKQSFVSSWTDTMMVSTSNNTANQTTPLSPRKFKSSGADVHSTLILPAVEYTPKKENKSKEKRMNEKKEVTDIKKDTTTVTSATTTTINSQEKNNSKKVKTKTTVGPLTAMLTPSKSPIETTVVDKDIQQSTPSSAGVSYVESSCSADTVSSAAPIPNSVTSNSDQSIISTNKTSNVKPIITTKTTTTTIKAKRKVTPVLVSSNIAISSPKQLTIDTLLKDKSMLNTDNTETILPLTDISTTNTSTIMTNPVTVSDIDISVECPVERAEMVHIYMDTDTCITTEGIHQTEQTPLKRQKVDAVKSDTNATMDVNKNEVIVINDENMNSNIMM